MSISEHTDGSMTRMILHQKYSTVRPSLRQTPKLAADQASTSLTPFHDQISAAKQRGLQEITLQPETTNRPQVLILTGGLGEGHRSPASAVGHELNLVPLNLETADIRAKATLAKRDTWDHFLYKLNDNRFLYQMVDLYRAKHKQKNTLAKVREKVTDKVDAIFVNNRYLTRFAARVCQEKGLEIPMIVTVADHGKPHSSWYPPKLLASHSQDLFVVPSREAVNHALKQGIPQNRVKHLGYPVRPDFERAAARPKAEVRAELGLPNDRKILLMSGGSGNWGAYMALLTEKLAQSGHDVHIVAVAGKNKELFQTLQKITADSPTTIQVLPECNAQEMANYSRACDFAATKAGGATLGELYHVGTIPIVYQQLSGVEHGNVKHVSDNNTGIVALTEKKFMAAVADLLHDNVDVSAMLHNQASYVKETPAKNIAAAVYQLAQVHFQRRLQMRLPAG